MLSGNVLQNPFVRSGRMAHVMLRREAIDRNRDDEMSTVGPLRGNWTKGAGDNLHVDFARQQRRLQFLWFETAEAFSPK